MRRAAPLSAALQLYHLRRNPIAVGSGAACLGTLTWVMEVTPTPVSRTYVVQVDLAGPRAPQVTLLSPDVRALARGRRLPHVYSDRPVRLCLYHPRRREWDASMRLDQTIVPWTYLWLYYFEQWLATDDWAGGGEHPETPPGKASRSQRGPAGLFRDRDESVATGEQEDGHVSYAASR